MGEGHHCQIRSSAANVGIFIETQGLVPQARSARAEQRNASEVVIACI